MSEYATGAINRPWRTDCVQHPCRDMAIRSRSRGETAKVTRLRLASHHPRRVTFTCSGQISIGKVPGTIMAMIRKVIATPSKIH